MEPTHWPCALCPLEDLDFLCSLPSVGLVALFVIDGPVNGELFRILVEQLLVPALQSGGTVVLDHLGAHKVAGVKAAIHGLAELD